LRRRPPAGSEWVVKKRGVCRAVRRASVARRADASLPLIVMARSCTGDYAKGMDWRGDLREVVGN
jgi:hypothetical protein